MRIIIEPEAFSTTAYRSGEIFVDEGNEQEVKEEFYEFTLCETYGEYDAYPSIDITFLDKVPDNREKVEQLIKEEFNKL